MQPVEVTVRLLAGLALILANGFFVAIEFALTRARQYSESEFDEPGLRRAWEMTDDLEIYLTSCQVGITASSIAVGIIAEPALAAIFEPYFESSVLAGVGVGGAIAFLLINLVHLTHGEQTPTYLGVERAKFVCRYGATPLYYFAWVISPIIKVGDGVAKWTLGLFGVEMSGAWLEAEVDSIESRAELRNELGSVLDRGDVSDERREEVLSAFRVGDREVNEVMVPREDIVALSPTDDDATNAERIAETPHTRYPLVGEALEEFLGIVYIPALVDEREEQAGDGGLLDRIDLEAVASPPMTMSPDTTVSDAIDQFQAERQELAFVLEDGDVVGLVTVTDLLEEVVGDIQDPMDAEAGVD
ncbi:CNNM domain-containing protein [Haloarcula marismortui]|uniref:Inosine monophosphate dehydrogenase n=1 Tax=Haloarcula marismortui ATCC 33799 TaxID=662475 RepID=M0K4Z1_9EURY|nr:hemolysin family protein [Haloarcula californiae]EMA16457.1 inosine monophosphate dehydrogenase [Haloarcula californiae ATCC 33799]